MRKLLLRFFLLCILPASHLYANGIDEDRFIWNEANAVMSRANSRDDFVKAAVTYNKLIERGTVNAAILYNLGTALILAGNYDQAVNALTRAERYAGTTWEIKRNLRLAMAKGDSTNLQPLPWYRYPLFWHYLMPTSQRLLFAICAYSLFWLALIFRLSRFKNTAATIVAISLLFLILFGSSAATSIYLENIASPIKITPAAESMTKQIGEQTTL